MTTQGIGDHLAELPATRLFVALWGGLATVDLARAADAPSSVQVALLAGLAAACSVAQPLRTALAAAAVTWLVTQGFVVHHSGSLVPAGPREGAWLVALLVLALATSAATDVSGARR